MKSTAMIHVDCQRLIKQEEDKETLENLDRNVTKLLLLQAKEKGVGGIEGFSDQ